MILQHSSLIQMAAMFQDKYVFSQLTAFLNRTQFNNYVRKYDGNRYVKHFTCWNQMLAMMFGQLSNCEILRDLIVAFEAHTWVRSRTNSQDSSCHSQRERLQNFRRFCILYNERSLREADNRHP